MMFSWIIVIVGIIWAIWYFNNNGARNPFEIKKEKPIDILNRRLASGEITEEEYESRKEALDAF